MPKHSRASTTLFKRIDHYVGLPICVALSLVAGAARLVFGKPKPVRPPRRVLVIKFFGLGSIGYSTVVANDLKREFPGVRVELLTFGENRGFATFLEAFDDIRVIRRSGAIAFAWDTARTMLANLSRPYDVCIDLEYFSKYTAMHTAFTRAPVRIGFYMRCLWRRFIYTDHAYFNTAKHIRRIYGMTAELAGVSASAETPVRIAMPADLVAAAERKLRGAGWLEGARLVGLNINASDLALGRRWEPERFARVAAAVAERGFCVGLTGAPGEHDYVERCREMIPEPARSRCLNLAGVLTIREFVAFLSLVDLFITSDSGPMIFAILADAPSVSLWGPGDPAMFGGDEMRHTHVYSAFPCSPCMYIPTTDAGKFCNQTFPCMAAIQVEDVRDAVLRRLEAA
ncbi:glycosyltransferase family 9 protein [bacterium]|nr:glycosyltransferase family 9 protein [bacterium]